MNTEKNEKFSNQLLTILATSGAAVGLGNMWRFPYLLTQQGGAVFLFVYLFFVIALGYPLMLTEFAIGRESDKTSFGAFSYFSKRSILGKTTALLGSVAMFMILSYYSIIAGWVLNYIVRFVSGNMVRTPLTQPEIFQNVVTQNTPAIFFTILTLVIVFLFAAKSMEKGLELFTKIFMPLFIVIFVALTFYGLSLSGAPQAINFLFKPDFSKISGGLILAALGQAFFSLSIANVSLINYGSYMKKTDSLKKTALATCGLDTLIAMISGIFVFSLIYTFNGSFEEGVSTLFVSTSELFIRIPGGMILGVLFYFLLFIAAITSIIMMFDNLKQFIVNVFPSVSLKKAAMIVLIVTIVSSSIIHLSQTTFASFTILGRNGFNLFDYISGTILTPLVGLLTAVFAGWVISPAVLKNQMELKTTLGAQTILFILRFFAPIVIAIILITGVL